MCYKFLVHFEQSRRIIWALGLGPSVLWTSTDRISELSNDLLMRILSFLSTKEAIQTSLLAIKVQNLWATVPVLDFNFDEFRPDVDTLKNLEANNLEEDEDDDDEEILWELHEEKFTKFADSVFAHRDQLINVDSFKLKWEEKVSNPILATKWLDTVAKLKPKFLSVNIFTEDYHFQVTDSIFSCKSLQEMELHLEFEAISPRSVNLPCLKKITLNSIEIVDEEMQKLSGLPTLEEMVLSDCYFNTFDISSGTLKRLVLDGYPDEITTLPDISISTVSLLYLEVIYLSIGIIKLKKLEYLVKAYIHYHKFANEDPMFLNDLSNLPIDCHLCVATFDN